MPNPINQQEIAMPLKFTGDGSASLPGVPARDLTEEDLAEVLRVEGITPEEILASKLYVVAKPVKGGDS